jgi:hypothetical protein
VFKKQLIVGILSIAGLSAFADGQSEIFYQTPAGKTAATAQVGFVNRDLKTLNSGGAATPQNVKESGMTPSGVRYEMGISDQFSVEAAITATNLSVTGIASGQDKGKVSGLDDVQLNFKGTTTMGFGHLRYGAFNRIGLSEAHYSSTGGKIANTNISSGTGGFTFTPYLGADMELGPGVFGARFSYDLVKHDNVYHTTDSSGYTYFTGAQKADVTVFYEFNFGASLVGLAVDMATVSSSNNNGTRQDGFSTLGVNLYGRYAATESWSVVPSVKMDSYMNKYAVDSIGNGHYISGGNDLAYNVSVRYNY